MGKKLVVKGTLKKPAVARTPAQQKQAAKNSIKYQTRGTRNV